MKKVKVFVLFSFVFNYYAHSSFAQENSNPFDGSSFGLTLMGLSNNEGYSELDFISPYFWKKGMAIKVGVEGLLYNYIHKDHDKYVQSTYYTLCLGIRVRTVPTVENTVHRYAEIGGLGIFPNKDFTDKKFPIGLYLKYGFEYTIESRRKYGFFIEANAKISNLRAEKALGSPYYANGGSLAIGCRKY
jgi:hypothetical protein